VTVWLGALVRWGAAHPEPWAHPAPGGETHAAADTGPTLGALLVGAFVATLVVTWLVDRWHPHGHVPPRRTLALLAATGTLALALDSPLARAADTSYSMHMVQHLLLTMVAAPLVALGAPITLLCRAVPIPIRRRVVLPMLHSHLLRGLMYPAVAWLVLIGVTWGFHLGPVYAAALDDPTIHQLEHVGLMAAALLFWAPVVAVDPVPWRLDEGARLAYVALAMPALSVLGLLIYSWPGVMWADYAAQAQGRDPLDDQRLAGIVMWLGSDLLMLGAFVLILFSGIRARRRSRGRASGSSTDARYGRPAMVEPSPDPVAR
jgi:cytochrome c oxidase assembly factor CtaG